MIVVKLRDITLEQIEDIKELFNVKIIRSNDHIDISTLWEENDDLLNYLETEEIDFEII